MMMMMWNDLKNQTMKKKQLAFEIILLGLSLFRDFESMICHR